MINPQWLELPMSRTNFHGPKDVQAIEVRLYIALGDDDFVFNAPLTLLKSYRDGGIIMKCSVQ